MDLACREARMEDAELLWRWASDAETRRNAFSKSAIAFEEHVAWLERRLHSDATRIWIFSDGDVPVGQVRFDIEGDRAEIDIAVAPERRGRGLGRAMLGEAVRRLHAERGARARPTASVLEDNVRSLRMFRACRFKEVGVVRRDTGERAIVLTLDADATTA